MIKLIILILICIPAVSASELAFNVDIAQANTLSNAGRHVEERIQLKTYDAHHQKQTHYRRIPNKQYYKPTQTSVLYQYDHVQGKYKPIKQIDYKLTINKLKKGNYHKHHSTFNCRDIYTKADYNRPEKHFHIYRAQANQYMCTRTTPRSYR